MKPAPRTRVAASPGRAARGAPARVEPPAIDRTLGHQIRDLRRAKGMTIPELAARIDRSVGWVSQIERGKSAVTIAALQQIAAVLEVQISWFFGAPQPVPAEELGLIVRRANRRTLDFSGAGVREEMLSPNLSGRLLVVETTFEPGASTGDRDRERHGEEAGVVLRGTLDLWVDGRRHRLQAGDSFAFARTGPHRCANPGKEAAVVLWIITPPSY
jgi:transcriptional regulator with XRE-family HTH domain